MYPIGGVSRPERQPKAREEVWIALAGPTVNLLIAIGLLAWVASRQGFVALEQLREPTDANLAERIAPVKPAALAFPICCLRTHAMARILRSILVSLADRKKKPRVAAAGAGQVLAALMWGWPGPLWGNFLLVFVASFAYLGASQRASPPAGEFSRWDSRSTPP